MKKALILILTLLAPFVGWSAESTHAIMDIAPGVTNMAANSTNSVGGGAIALPLNGSAKYMFVQARFTGNASSTNGPTSVSNVVFKFSVSIDGTNFTDGATSNYRFTVPLNGAGSTSGGDIFYLPGIKKIKSSVIELNGGTVTNLVIQGGIHN